VIIVYNLVIDLHNYPSINLQVGTVWINSWLVRDLDLPFGGSKDSGIGREGTQDSWDFYTEQKTVSLKIQ